MYWENGTRTVPRLNSRYFLLALGFTIVLGADRAEAQTVLDWNDFEPCESCRLEAREFLRLGELQGDGIIESWIVRVVAAEGRGYLVYGQEGRGGTRFSVFDEDGTFRATIGREGDGPGELRNINDLSFTGDDEILILDGQRRRWITLEDDGSLVADVPLGEITPGRFRLVEGDTVAVMGVMGRRPSTVGYPLHLVGVRDGEPRRHFGSGDPESWSAMRPYAGTLVLGESSLLQVGDAVWWAEVGRPQVEKWSLDGTPRLRITGELDWFPVPDLAARRSAGVPPLPTTASLAVDDEARLWLLTSVPGEDWRDVELVGPERAVPPEERDTWRDVRLDVFDLARRRHVGTLRLDSTSAQLLVLRGEVLLYQLEYETPVWPRVVLYQVHLLDDPQSRR